MREVTVQELVKAFEGQLVNIEAYEHYGISIDMEKACIDYHEDLNELTFTAGNYNHDGIGTVCINVDDSVDCIEIDDDEDEPFFVITFTGYMSDMTISRWKSLEELEEERRQRKARREQ